jgi:hypothetical protein
MHRSFDYAQADSFWRMLRCSKLTQSQDRNYFWAALVEGIWIAGGAGAT